MELVVTKSHDFALLQRNREIFCLVFLLIFLILLGVSYIRLRIISNLRDFHNFR